MSKVTLIHGTTKSSLDTIMVNGWGNRGDNAFIWLCSEDDYSYFWNCNKIQIDMTDKGMTGDLSSAKEVALYNAYESAAIASCVNETDDYLYAIVVEIDSQYVEDDDTVEADDFASCVTHSNLNTYGEIVEIRKMNFNRYLLPLIANSVWQKEQFNVVWLLDGLYETLQYLPKTEIDLTDLFAYEASSGSDIIWKYRGT